jgi:hypothetical protein
MITTFPPSYVSYHLKYMACAKLGLDLDDAIDVISSTQSYAIEGEGI